MSMKSMKGKWIKYIPLLGLCLPVSGQADVLHGGLWPAGGGRVSAVRAVI